MNRILLGLLLVGVVAGQPPCIDVQPTVTFPCEFQLLTGGCDPPYDALKDELERVVYCIQSCGLCDSNIADLAVAQIAVSVEPIVHCATLPYPWACAEVTPISYNALAQAVVSNMTEAIASIQDADLDPFDTTPVIRAANAAARAVTTAIASRMAEVSLRGLTSDRNSFVFGVVNSSATAVATATAEAYAVAIAEVGSDFTELEALALITDIQTALVNAAVELSGTGAGTIATVSQTSYATAIAEVVANATAQAFAKIWGGNVYGITVSYPQAFNTSQLTCLSICNEDPPPGDRTCYSYVTAGECPNIAGSCECACDTCSAASEASIAAYVNLISESGENQENTISAFGEAFATGAGGVNAVAAAISEAVTQGAGQATASAIAEAFGAVNQISANAIVEAVAIAINNGGQDVVQAVADGFALAEKGGDASSLAQAISTALTSPDVETATATAITQAISTAIADGGCAAIAESLTEAQATVEREENGPAFAAAIADSESINSCLPGSEDQYVYAVSDLYTGSTSIGDAAADAQAIAAGIKSGDTVAFADAIASAAAEGRASDVADGIATALSDGVETIAIVEAVASAVNTGNDGVVAAVAQAFAEAQDSYAGALSEVYAEGLGNGGSNAEALATPIARAVFDSGCQAVATALSEAQTKAQNRGKGSTFAGALSKSVAACLGSGFASAQAISAAVVEDDAAALAAAAAAAFDEFDAEAVAQGLALAFADGQNCTAISEAASIAVSEAQAVGIADVFSTAVAAATSVSNCLRQGLASCRGTVERSCCTDQFPLECNCRGTTCRSTMNQEKSIMLLGLYVYNEGVGSRTCACDQMA